MVMVVVLVCEFKLVFIQGLLQHGLQQRNKWRVWTMNDIKKTNWHTSPSQYNFRKRFYERSWSLAITNPNTNKT